MEIIVLLRSGICQTAELVCEVGGTYVLMMRRVKCRSKIRNAISRPGVRLATLFDYPSLGIRYLDHLQSLSNYTLPAGKQMSVRTPA